MSNSAVIRYVVSGIVGLVIGVIFTAVLNFVSPPESLVRTAILVCLASMFSAFSGYLLGARRKK